MSKTNIEWADKSLNYYNWRCNKVSEGCKFCYMMTFAKRMGKDPVGAPEWRENAMREYHALKPGEVVFINSMSDTYHELAEIKWVHRIHELAAQKPDVIFLSLTKRPHNALAFRDSIVWPKNLWIGTSIEMPKYLYRIDTLLQIPAAGHFISVEPLLESLGDISKYFKRGLGWVILGAESGKHRRDFDMAWARDIKNQCLANNVPFIFKQGSHFKSGQKRILDGRTWDETPFANSPESITESYQMSLFD